MRRRLFLFMAHLLEWRIGPNLGTLRCWRTAASRRALIGAHIDPILVIPLVFAALAAAWIAARVGRGWRAAVVFASFLPALVLWAYVLAASVFLALLLLGIAAID
jgi:hypothetical protein